MASRSGTWWFLPLLLVAACAWADDDEIFLTDNFVDPRDLGTKFNPDGSITAGGTYRQLDASAGYIGHYEDRSLFSGQNREFGDIGYYRYWSNWQAIAGSTFFDPDGHATTWRARFGIGRYQFNPGKESQDKDRAALDDAFVSRWMVNAVLDNRFGLGPQYEITLSEYVQVPLPLVPSALKGGLSLSYRGGESQRDLRLLYGGNYDFVVFHGNRGRINGGYWLGFEHADRVSRFTPAKAQVLIEYRVFRKLEVHAAYAYEHGFGGGVMARGSNHEWLLSLYCPVFAGLEF
jgi:hypothetical protein